jgi:hypothetical protein
VEREDSGVIDLFALCQRASATPARDMTPPDVFSMPPPAFTTDVSDDDDSLANPFAKPSRKKLGIIAAAGAGLLLIGIVFASVSGGSAEPTTKASAAGRIDPASVAAALTVPPVAVQAPTPVPSASINLPPPPTTGAAISPKPPAARAQPAVLSKPRPAVASGPKLVKVQSGGVAAH